MDKILIGTTNPTKVEIYNRILSGQDLHLVTLSKLNIKDVPREDGETIEENAILKAKFYCKISQLPAIADDAGFEIPALDDFPGTHSRRFAGHDMTDTEVIKGILEKMKDLKGNQRKARMKAVVALAFPDGRVRTESAFIEGSVPSKPYERKKDHFPYRSLLYIDSLGKWFYDLTDKEESELGYRTAAIQRLRKYLI